MRLRPREQVAAGLVPAGEVVAADRQAGLVWQHRAPAHEGRGLIHQLLQLAAMGEVVAVAEQDQPVRLLAVGVVGVPVVRELLERDQQVLPVAGAGAGDRAQHRREERVDVRGVAGRVFEQQQRRGAGALGAQAGGVLVDLVVQLLRRPRGCAGGFPVHQRAAAQGRETVDCDTPPGGRYRTRWRFFCMPPECAVGHRAGPAPGRSGPLSTEYWNRPSFPNGTVELFAA